MSKAPLNHTHTVAPPPVTPWDYDADKNVIRADSSPSAELNRVGARRDRVSLSAVDELIADDCDNLAASFSFESTPSMRRDRKARTAGEADISPLRKIRARRITRRKEVAPHLLAEMHQMSEKTIKASTMQAQSSGASIKRFSSTMMDSVVTLVATSEAEICEKWGENDTWQISGKLPYSFGVANEPVYNERRFQIYPEIGSNYDWKSFSTSTCTASIAGRPVRDAVDVLKECGIAVRNMKGRKEALGDLSFGQDNFSVTRLRDGWEAITVMDGHGHKGHWPATCSARVLPYFLQTTSAETMLKQNQIQAALHYAFDLAQAQLEQHAEEEKVFLEASGCAALCCLWNTNVDLGKRSIWVATAGDTRAVLLVPGHGVVASTVDHKPNAMAERQRIHEAGGECRVAGNSSVQGLADIQDGEEEDLAEVERVYIKGEDWPGLAMTRSLGDMFCKVIGVTHVPEVVEWSLADRPGAILLAACDGLWDFLDQNEVGNGVLEYLAKGNSLEEVADELLAVARRSWKENAEEYTDDITIMLVPFPDDRGAVTRSLTVSERVETKCYEGICRSGCTVS